MPSIQLQTKCDGMWLKSQHWCDRDRKILRIQWPGSLAKTVSPSFMERLWLKKADFLKLNTPIYILSRFIESSLSPAWSRSKGHDSGNINRRTPPYLVNFVHVHNTFQLLWPQLSCHSDYIHMKISLTYSFINVQLFGEPLRLARFICMAWVCS